MKSKGTFFQKVMLMIFVYGCLINTAWADGQKTVIKLACLAQKGVSAMSYLDETAFPGFTNATDGEVVFDIYWGGLMGDEEDYISKMRTGQLQGALLSGSGGVTSSVCPDLSVVELPFLFNEWAWDEVDYVMDKIRPHLFKEAEKKGFKLLLISNVDFDQIYSTKHNIASMEDIRGAKMLTWFGPLENKMLKAIGVSAIPVNVPEVVSSMKTGICNMAIAPSMWWVGAQLYTDTKYVNPLPIRYVPGLVVWSMDVWNKISEKNKKNINVAGVEYERGFKKKIKESNEKAYNAMLRYGIKEVKVSPEELVRLKKATRPVWDELAGKVYSREILDEVIGLLENYRKNKKNVAEVKSTGENKKDS